MYREKSTGWLKHIDFIFLDLICLHIAFVAAYMIRHGINNPYFNLHYRKIAMIYTMADLIVIFCYGTMKNVLKRGYYKEFVKTLSHVFLAEFIVVFYMFTTQEGHIYSRTTILLAAIFYLFLTYCIRILWRYHIKRSAPYVGKRSLLVVAAYNDARAFADDIYEKYYWSFQISGFAILDQKIIGQRINNIPVVADSSSIIQYLCREWVDEVFIMKPKEDPFTVELVGQCMQMGLTTHVEIGEVFDSPGCKQMIESIGNHTVITSSTNMISLEQEFAKRILDIIGGIGGCVVAVILTVFLGPVIYLQSPGPIFFV